MLKQVWRLGPDLLGEPKFVAFISKTTVRKMFWYYQRAQQASAGIFVDLQTIQQKRHETSTSLPCDSEIKRTLHKFAY